MVSTRLLLPPGWCRLVPRMPYVYPIDRYKVINSSFQLTTLTIGDVPYVDEQAVKENHRRPLTPCHIDAERAIHSMMDVNVNRRTKLYDILNLAFFATTNDRLMPISSLQTTKLPQNMSLTSTQF